MKKKKIIFVIMTVLLIVIVISSQYFSIGGGNSIESNVLSLFKDSGLLQSIEKEDVYNSGYINEPAVNTDKKDVNLELNRISVEHNMITLLGTARPNDGYNVDISNDNAYAHMPEFMFSTDYKNDTGTLHSLKLIKYEVYTEGNKLFFLQQYEVPYVIYDMSNLYIETHEVLESSGFWSFVIVTKENEDDKIVFNPNLEHSILNNTRDIKIKEVSFINNKGEIIIEQSEGASFSYYALKDKDNNFYSIINVYGSSIGNNNSTTTLEFYYPKTTIEDLILVPISIDLETDEVIDNQLNLPSELSISDIGSISIESINFKPDYLKLELKFHGANLPGADIRTGAFGLVDRDGNYIRGLDFISNFNYQTGTLTMTSTNYSKEHPNLASKFSGVWYVRQKGLSLIEADSVLIPLGNVK